MESVINKSVKNILKKRERKMMYIFFVCQIGGIIEKNFGICGRPQMSPGVHWPLPPPSRSLLLFAFLSAITADAIRPKYRNQADSFTSTAEFELGWRREEEEGGGGRRREEVKKENVLNRPGMATESKWMCVYVPVNELGGCGAALPCRL